MGAAKETIPLTGGYFMEVYQERESDLHPGPRSIIYDEEGCEVYTALEILTAREGVNFVRGFSRGYRDGITVGEARKAREIRQALGALGEEL